MRIGVSGASGHLGVATVAELVRRGGGHEIVGISHSPDRVPAPAMGRLGDYAPSPFDGCAPAGSQRREFATAPLVMMG
jgi:uncharacterized protein YbjT (DUF2867 family)